MVKKPTAPRRIPIKALSKFAKALGLDVAVLLGWSQENGRQHVVTWGRTTEQCDVAAQMGNKIKALAGWPPEHCGAEPSRVKTLKARIKELEERLREFEQQLEAAAYELGDLNQAREAAEYELDQELDQP